MPGSFARAPADAAGEARILTSAAEFARQFGRWSQVAASRPVFVTHHGRPTHVLMSIHDHDRIAGGDALAGRRPIEAIAAWIDQGLLVCDRDHVVLLANQAAHDLLRRRGGTLVGQRPWDGCTALRDTVVEQAVRRTTASGEGATVELASPVRAGCRLRVAVRAFDDGAVVLLRDVTAETVDRRRVDARRAMARAVARHGDIACVRLDPRGHVVEADAAFHAMVGLDPDRLRGVAIADLVLRADRAAVRQQLAAPSDAVIDFTVLTNDGVLLPLRAGIAALCDDQGGDGTMLVAIRR